MIGKNAQKLCCEDISLVENYEQAINDTTQTWHCHHRFEVDLGLSMKELNDRNLYYNRPASELIFLTPSEHAKIHMQGNPMYGKRGKEAPMYGKNCEDHMSEEAIKERRKKIREKNRQAHLGKHHTEKTKKIQSEKKKAEKNPAYGRTWMNNGITRAYPKSQEEIEYYRELGYRIGYKLK